MALAIGPCMLLAPLVAVLLIVTWPLEQLCGLPHIPAFVGTSAAVRRWLSWTSMPLNWFDQKEK